LTIGADFDRLCRTMRSAPFHPRRTTLARVTSVFVTTADECQIRRGRRRAGPGMGLRVRFDDRRAPIERPAVR